MMGNAIMTINRMGVLLTLGQLIARENTGECLKAIRVKMPDFQMPQGLIKPIDGCYRTITTNTGKPPSCSTINGFENPEFFFLVSK